MSKIFVVLDGEMERYLLEMFEIETYVRDREIETERCLRCIERDARGKRELDVKTKNKDVF